MKTRASCGAAAWAALGVCIAAAVVVTAAPAVATTPSTGRGGDWTVASNGIELAVPATWPVFGSGQAPCPRSGGAVWVDQPRGLPAPSCPAFPSSLRGTMVVLGQPATTQTTGHTTTLNGLRASIATRTTPTPAVTAVFPAQDAELVITTYGPPSHGGAPRPSLATDVQILHSVRAAKYVYQGQQLPSGAPMKLTVTSLTRSLEPYNPMVGNHGIPVEVVHYTLARPPTSSFVCQTAVWRRGKVVGVGASEHGGPAPGTAGPAPGTTGSAGASPRRQAETVQLTVPTFNGPADDATVVCRPS